MTTTFFSLVLIVSTVFNVMIPGALLFQLRRLQRALAVASIPSLTMVMERELTANQVALGVMQDAVDVKRELGIEVVPETYTALGLLRTQTDRLAQEIAERRRVDELARRRWAARPSDTADTSDTPD